MKKHKQEHTNDSNICDISQVDKKEHKILNEHVSEHVTKEKNCDSCGIITKEDSNFKLHLRNTHGVEGDSKEEETEQMEVDEEIENQNKTLDLEKEKLDRIKRSEMHDKKVIEYQRKRDEEEQKQKLKKRRIRKEKD